MRYFQLPGRSPVLATNGMCATSHPLAAKIAIDTLARGGNAVDAAIAGAVILGLCEPQMTGLGGDAFALIKPAGGEDILALNGSGRAAQGSSAQKLRAQGLKTVPVNSAHAVTVPGAVDAFCTLSDRLGKLGMADILGPLIPYFESGVPIAPRVAFDWALAKESLQGSARDVYLAQGKPLKTGHQFALPGQAEVLRRIADKGRDGFYVGEVAEDMVATLKAAGGAHVVSDFAATACDWTDPISGTYKGIDLVEHPPNGQGATAILMANILKHFDITALDPMGSKRAHIEAEAAKLAYDARNRLLADHDHTVRLMHMLDAGTAEKLAALINPKRAMAAAAPLTEAIHKDTVYITVVDRDRMAVSLICSIFHSFGTGLASDKFGILMQNRGAGFTLERWHPNELGPGKRPMHTIIPGMLRQNGRVTMPFGVMGGAYQPAGHLRFLSNMVDFGMDAQSAIDAPRAFSDNGVMSVELGYSDTVRAELYAMGHNVRIPEGPIGGAQSIRIDDSGYLEGASDPRKDGCALGY
ncbi:MAG: gamma-glutamyltransferase family protein [Jannaschia helgolandensis]|uniref:Gamma-glutamyltransferase 2. Threonine peptidase. MEROPS family T03 n=1 Tax=Jannaschia helgolandensis TaxID=188906 RepID=A0A1H7HHK6_9RHOB|nr:gamma-glutamyltransferase family protein [Jannaschia helgolandensis]SEK49769.1 gamma-glutamyltransferase 2. Threonine peptidase. MEROPS family T03 [Jannaschia helgolandensis]